MNYLNPRHQQGFTLIELMITIVILGITLAVGLPGLNNLREGVALNSSANQLVGSLAFARSEAAFRVTLITICHSANGETCGGGSGSGWDKGWIVKNEADDTVYRVVDSSTNDVLIAGIDEITFDNEGQKTTQLGVATAANVDLTLQNSAKTSSRTITITPSGNISLKK